MRRNARLPKGSRAFLVFLIIYKIGKGSSRGRRPRVPESLLLSVDDRDVVLDLGSSGLDRVLAALLGLDDESPFLRERGDDRSGRLAGSVPSDLDRRVILLCLLRHRHQMFGVGVGPVAVSRCGLKHEASS